MAANVHLLYVRAPYIGPSSCYFNSLEFLAQTAGTPWGLGIYELVGGIQSDICVRSLRVQPLFARALPDAFPTPACQVHWALVNGDARQAGGNSTSASVVGPPVWPNAPTLVGAIDPLGFVVKSLAQLCPDSGIQECLAESAELSDKASTLMVWPHGLVRNLRGKPMQVVIYAPAPWVDPTVASQPTTFCDVIVSAVTESVTQASKEGISRVVGTPITTS
jgi:hypothetical protein